MQKEINEATKIGTLPNKFTPRIDEFLIDCVVHIFILIRAILKLWPIPI